MRFDDALWSFKTVDFMSFDFTRYVPYLQLAFISLLGPFADMIGGNYLLPSYADDLKLAYDIENPETFSEGHEFAAFFLQIERR